VTTSTVSTTEANVATFRRAIEEGWNRGNLAAIDELLAPDFVEHQAAFPDLHLVVEDAIADGDRVWLRLHATGTHDGPFMGMPGTGRPFEITVIDIARVVDGRLVEHWGVADRLSLVQQLGLAPGGPR
jgi:predicted ester cyclase